MVNSESLKSADVSNESMHVRDVNSHEIFKNNVLTSQFLKDYTGISLFADIRPEDIEDETVRFRKLLGIEVEGDSVKKVRLRKEGDTEDVYVISLIEHKSRPDPDTIMQVLIYMSVIWKDYANKMNKDKKNANKAAGFRYPLIVPVIYYEGKGEWTTGMRLSDRISHAELAKEFVPDFTCKFVPLREYRNKDLVRYHNEMSLIMMINKIQGPEDFHEFRENDLDYLKTIYTSATADIQKLILDVIWSLLMKINVAEDEASVLLKNVKEGEDVGVLFNDLKPWDWKGMNEKLKKAEARADVAEARADDEKARADNEKKRADEMEKQISDIKNSAIEKWKSENRPQGQAVSDLMDLFGMDEEDAISLWNGK